MKPGDESFGNGKFDVAQVRQGLNVPGPQLGERAFAVGGTLDVTSASGAGVRVRLALPSAGEKE